MGLCDFFEKTPVVSISTSCRQRHQPRTASSHAQLLCSLLRSLVVRVYSHTLTSMHLQGSRLKRASLCLAAKHFILGAPCPTPCRICTHGPLPPHLSPNQSSSILNNHAKINGHSSVATFCEPNRIAEDRDHRHFTGDGQFIELEDLRVRPLSVHQSIQWKASQLRGNRTLMTNDFVLCWLHHCTYRSEKKMRNDHKFVTLNEKT